MPLYHQDEGDPRPGGQGPEAEDRVEDPEDNQDCPQECPGPALREALPQQGGPLQHLQHSLPPEVSSINVIDTIVINVIYINLIIVVIIDIISVIYIILIIIVIIDVLIMIFLISFNIIFIRPVNIAERIEKAVAMNVTNKWASCPYQVTLIN